MNKKEIGKFNAVSFNEEIDLEFIVYDDNSIDCSGLNLYDYNRINLKPNFELVKLGEHKQICETYIYNIKSKSKGENSLNSIGRYDIDDELFSYLKDNDMIRYSHEMANLYGFDDKDEYSVSGLYKRAKVIKMDKKRF